MFVKITKSCPSSSCFPQSAPLFLSLLVIMTCLPDVCLYLPFISIYSHHSYIVNIILYEYRKKKYLLQPVQWKLLRLCTFPDAFYLSFLSLLYYSSIFYFSSWDSYNFYSALNFLSNLKELSESNNL